MTDAVVFFFNDTATTEIYTLSLHDALPILGSVGSFRRSRIAASTRCWARRWAAACGVSPERSASASTADALARSFVEIIEKDRKSTRLNSSHANISYAVFCLKKKTTTITI